jgi:RNA polymerase sigma factor (sigma-70 family)
VPEDETADDRYAEGYEAYFDLIFERRGKEIFAYAARLLGYQDAEDIVQQVLLVVWTRIRWFSQQPEWRQSRWLRAVTRNTAVNVMRRRLGTGPLPRSMEEFDEIAHSSDRSESSVETTMLTNAAVDRCLQAIRELPRQQQFVVSLAMEGWTYRRIAGWLGIAQSTARSHYQMALGGLRDQLKGEADLFGACFEEDAE